MSKRVRGREGLGAGKGDIRHRKPQGSDVLKQSQALRMGKICTTRRSEFKTSATEGHLVVNKVGKKGPQDERKDCWEQ